MAVKNLEVLKGTQYHVEVTRAVDGDYDVEVYKPANTDDPYIELELVAVRYLPNKASEQELSRLVAEIISSDQPSLVGTYTDTEESNGNRDE